MLPKNLAAWLSCCSLKVPTLYLVGGTVRDLLLGEKPKDIDLVCKQAKAFAYRLGNCRDAAVVPMEKKADAPCYRVVDRGNTDNFLDIAEIRGETIYDDLGQRDFTMNAIAVEVHKDGSPGLVIDPFEGAKDIERKTIQSISAAAFESDPLRILRSFRFSATLNFTIGLKTLQDMKSRAVLLTEVSAERIMAELMLLLKTSQSTVYIREMDSLGVLEVLFPEITPMKGCMQNGFHHKDVWEHSLLALGNCEQIINDLPGYFGEWAEQVSLNLAGNARAPLLKLASLLHDLGKPVTRGLNPVTGRITFYSHDSEGARAANTLAERMKLSGQQKDYLVLLVSEHLHLLSLAGKDVKASARARWFRRMKEDTIPAIILGIADVKSSLGSESTEKWRAQYIAWSKSTIQEYYSIIRKRIEAPQLINGRDLIALGLSPGPKMGQILNIIMEAQDCGEISTKGEAMAMVRELMVLKMS